jgi:hypothetical protein
MEDDGSLGGEGKGGELPRKHSCSEGDPNSTQPSRDVASLSSADRRTKKLKGSQSSGKEETGGQRVSVFGEEDSWGKQGSSEEEDSYVDLVEKRSAFRRSLSREEEHR